MRAGGAEGDQEGDGRRTLVNGWESRQWRLEDKHLRKGSSVRQFGRPRPLRIRHRRRRRRSSVVMIYTINSFTIDIKRKKDNMAKINKKDLSDFQSVDGAIIFVNAQVQ